MDIPYVIFICIHVCVCVCVCVYPRDHRDVCVCMRLCNGVCMYANANDGRVTS
jgi:hypothetical protein